MWRYSFLWLLIATLFCFCKSPDNSTNETFAKAKKGYEATVTEEKVIMKAPAYIDLNYVMGKFDPATHEAFAEVDIKYADQAGRWLHKDCYEAFKKMHLAAANDGISLTIKSAARNFDYQKGIWERKWKGITKLSGNIDATSTYPEAKERALAILQYSSMPGSSRHHWGTDLDVNAFTNSYFEAGEGLKVYDWLSQHAIEYGFCQPYTPKGAARLVGYEEEKWHWSYLPIADFCTALAQDSFDNKLLGGFLGSETAEQIDIKSSYILGINTHCLPNTQK